MKGEGGGGIGGLAGRLSIGLILIRGERGQELTVDRSVFLFLHPRRLVRDRSRSNPRLVLIFPGLTQLGTFPLDLFSLDDILPEDLGDVSPVL